MKKKLLIIVAIILVVTTSIIGSIVWSSRNTAKTEAKNVLREFTVNTSSQWYCENGYGGGIDNQSPWWEEIYVSNADSEPTAKMIEEYLKNKGYSTKNKFFENSRDSYNQGKTYWEIEGTRNNYSVQVRVSNKKLTSNNCYKGISNMNKSLSPENNNSVIVVFFRDGL